eukprot:TRINITY_DN31103_c0_g1_i1.p1 TRINITY_DN31103_c0_g1~~TRINITY_DN31103_c0_g1_i1.p1  ORF type:complete len:169 (-),score=28.00 TRINITY_DN31103_c0_g1_i1:443-949(-)
METSIRYNSTDSKFHIHAKERVFFDSYSYLKIHGKINMHTGEAHGSVQLKQSYQPQKYSLVDVGIDYNTEKKEVACDLQWKSKLPIISSGSLHLDTKGGYKFLPHERKGKPRGAVEIAYELMNFQQEQDIRLKVGYSIIEKKPYLQIKENNWTLNADINGSWSIKYDL